MEASRAQVSDERVPLCFSARECPVRRPAAVVSFSSSRGGTCVPRLAMVPHRVIMAQGFTRSLYCPTPDQPRSALPSAAAVKLPAAVEMPLTERLSRRPAFFAYCHMVLPPISTAS